jgi:hypothetical protein
MLPAGFKLIEDNAPARQTSALPEGFKLIEDPAAEAKRTLAARLNAGERGDQETERAASFLPDYARLPAHLKAEADRIEEARGKSAFADASASTIRGIPFGDEIMSRLGSPIRAAVDWSKGKGFDLGRAYEEGQALESELQRRRDERSPVASTVGAIAGGMIPAGEAAKAGFSLMQGARPTIASMAGRASAEGAAWGALYGAGEGEGEGRLKNAAYGAATGGAAGAAIGGLGRIGAGGRVTKTTVDDLREMGRVAYQRADDAGVAFTPQAMRKLYDNIVTDFTEFGFLPKNQPGAAEALNEIRRQIDGNISLKGLDTLRKAAGNSYVAGNKSNNELVGKMIRRIDEVVASPGAGDVLMGDAQAGASALREARDYWGRAAKLDTLEKLLERAGMNAASSGTGGNVENATRQQLKRILTSEKAKRGFTADEEKALKEAVLGTITQSFLRQAGRAAPGTGGLSNMLWSGLAGAAGYGTGGAGAIPVAAAGVGAMAARRASEAMSRAKVERLADLIVSGGTFSKLPQARVSNIRQAIIDSLTRGSAEMLPTYISQ